MRSTCSVDSGRNRSRCRIVCWRLRGSWVRGTSAMPASILRMPSTSKAVSSSRTNNGLPAALSTSAHRPSPGRAPVSSVTIARTLDSSSASSVSERPPARAKAERNCSTSGGPGPARMPPISVTGRCLSRLPRMASTRRLEGSAQCRSSRISTTDRVMASASTRSTNQSTTWYCRPGSLDTVGPSGGLGGMATIRPDRASLAVRPGGSAALTRPKGRVRSSSRARAVATNRPRARSASAAAPNTQDFPIPGLPCTRTPVNRPGTAESTASARPARTGSRPKHVMDGSGASISGR